jgi:hypothetical protein
MSALFRAPLAGRRRAETRQGGYHVDVDCRGDAKAAWSGNLERRCRSEAWITRGHAAAGEYVMRLTEAGSFEREAIEPVDDQFRHDGECAFAIFSEALALAEGYNAPFRPDAWA